jgi:hypothetical protein
MPLNKKETAWKKSRKFGDVKGGRRHPKISNGIFRKFHTLKPPTFHDKLPIFLKDNPSKDFYFPADEIEISSQLLKLPETLTDEITHIWLRRIKTTDYQTGNELQAIFICGSGVNLIAINAFPRDLKMQFGDEKPNRKTLRFYSKWIGDQSPIRSESGKWFLQWSEAAIKDYYLNHLLLHEVGHFVDRYSTRVRSKTSRKEAEDFAESFAILWNAKVATSD